MNDNEKTKAELIAELEAARKQIKELETLAAENSKTKRALHVSRQQLKSVVTSVPLILWSTNSNRVLTLLEGKGLQTLYLEPEQLIGRPVDDLFRDYPEILNYNNQALDGQSVGVLITVNQIIYEILFTPLRNEVDEVIGMIGVAIDITRYRHAEDTLRNYLQFLETLLNTFPNPVFYKEKDGLFLGCNRIFAELIIGLPREQIIGRSIYDFPNAISTDLADILYAREVYLLREGGEHWYETQVDCQDGLVREFLTAHTAFRDAADNIVGIVGVMSDITERKQMKETLLQRNMELALLNRTSEEFLNTLDLDTVLANVLEEARQLLDVTGCSAWLIDEETGELVCGHATVHEGSIVRGWRLASGQGIVGVVAQEGETLIVGDTRADDRHFKEIDTQIGVEVRSILSVPLKLKQTAKSNQSNVIGVLQVVDTEANRFGGTEIRLLEPLAANAAIAIENARLYDQTRQDAETKEVLLREVNHRVKNNLAAIIGLLYAERRHSELEEQEVFQSVMKNLINRVQGLATVHRMLSASEWTPLSLNKLTQQVIHSALRVVPRTKRVLVQVSPTSVQVSAKQANSLALIINELATNTVKYGLLNRDQAKIIVTVKRVDEMVEFEFRDDGPGYPAETLTLKQHNVGFYLIQAIVRDDLRGSCRLHNDGGAVTIISFKVHK
ncbi:GAF domain-containing protein [Anaerolineales bacterium HSG24]|nr:GAF domain-containing protein [Anaerolineales bacterium HSG24]